MDQSKQVADHGGSQNASGRIRLAAPTVYIATTGRNPARPLRGVGKGHQGPNSRKPAGWPYLCTVGA